MEELVQNRLKKLREEFEAGTHQLKILEARIEELRHTLLRISGAIQVLEELQQEPGQVSGEMDTD